MEDVVNMSIVYKYTYSQKYYCVSHKANAVHRAAILQILPKKHALMLLVINSTREVMFLCFYFVRPSSLTSKLLTFYSKSALCLWLILEPDQILESGEYLNYLYDNITSCFQ